MLKLLLREDRHWYKTEYLFRFLVSLAVLGSILLVILAITLGAPYALVYVEKGIIEKELEEIKNSQLTKERVAFTEVAVRLNQKVNYLSRENHRPSFFVTEVITNQPDGIGINFIGYRKESLKDGEKDIELVNLELKGVAINRTTLVNFQKSLESNELFETARVPFSSFTKERDIPFTINIKTTDLIQYFKEKENA
jgi:hypothetical protein